MLQLIKMTVEDLITKVLDEHKHLDPYADIESLQNFIRIVSPDDHDMMKRNSKFYLHTNLKVTLQSNRSKI